MRLGWISVCGALLLAGKLANAQPPERETTTVYTPNPGLVATGAVILAGTYIPSVIIAAESSNSADKNLFIPLVGPWIDLAERGGCPANMSCDSETTNKALLIGDGILQAVGTVAFVSGFVFPLRNGSTRARLEVRPMQLGRGPSLGAGISGSF